MTTVAPPREAFELREAVALGGSVVAEDGTVKLVVIRPTVGRGKGRHLYTADMLRENAHKFTGWKMFVDHQSDEARKAAGGLPRGVRDLGGRVIEAAWDPDVPAEGRFGQGAVVATVKPTKFIRELIEDDPELLEASINARATSVRPTVVEGRKAWLVEGIEDHGSVDWVTEGGAGGRVGALLEAVYHLEHAEDLAMLDSLTDEELVRALRRDRPDLVEALVGTGGPSGDTPDAAKPDDTPTPTSEVEVQITPEALREALDSDEGREIIRDLVEQAVAEERDLIRAEARADADRVIQLHDMERQAHRMIESAKLPQRWTENLRSRFELTEAGPADGLDVIDDIDETGNLVRRAEDKLEEAVQGAIQEARELIAESGGRTRVVGQGASTPEPGTPPQREEVPLWKQHLQEAGVQDVDNVYNLQD